MGPFSMSKTSVHDASNFILADFLARRQLIGEHKLQKLLYYAQGWHLIKYWDPLFDGEFQAWVHGPIHPEVHRRFAPFHWQPIRTRVRKPRLPLRVVDLLQGVLTDYGRLSSLQLEYNTRHESPWKKARERAGVPFDQDSPEPILISDMRDYFEQKLNDMNRFPPN